MLVEYNETGQITHIVSDPVSDGLIEVMQTNNRTFLSLPPQPTTMVSEVIKLDDGTEQMLEYPSGYENAQVDIISDYVKDGLITKRPIMNVPSSVSLKPDGIDTVTVTGLPAGVTVVVDGQTYLIEDGVLEITCDTPSNYAINLSVWPYMPAQIQVTANEA